MLARQGGGGSSTLADSQQPSTGIQLVGQSGRSLSEENSLSLSGRSLRGMRAREVAVFLKSVRRFLWYCIEGRQRKYLSKTEVCNERVGK